MIDFCERWAEKRKYNRYMARDGAIVALNPHASILGQMIDISLGGLAFRYIETEKQPGQAVELIILVANRRFHLDNIPFRTVTDIRITDNISFSSIKMRRRSVEFGNLSTDQICAIKDFIMKHTVPSRKQQDQIQIYQRQASAIL
jgi:hypothetical protein